MVWNPNPSPVPHHPPPHATPLNPSPNPLPLDHGMGWMVPIPPSPDVNPHWGRFPTHAPPNPPQFPSHQIHILIAPMGMGRGGMGLVVASLWWIRKADTRTSPIPTTLTLIRVSRGIYNHARALNMTGRIPWSGLRTAAWVGARMVRGLVKMVLLGLGLVIIHNHIIINRMLWGGIVVLTLWGTGRTTVMIIVTIASRNNHNPSPNPPPQPLQPLASPISPTPKWVLVIITMQVI